jgi:quercetin dioxygenase-like cupin family protein
MQPTNEGSQSSRNLEEPVRQLDLRHEAQEAWRQLSEVHAGHTARTLYKQAMHRAVLLVIKKGAKLAEHKADGECSLYVLKGRVSLALQGRKHELRAGEFLGLAFGQPHDVEGLEDTELLLTLSQVR